VANELRVMKKVIDLDTVEDMDDKEYNALYRYVAQWDKAEWTNALHRARTGEDGPVHEASSEAPTSEDPIENMTVEELKAELTLHDLPHSGNKAELQDRLREAGGLAE
jgi:hypothetical protein